ncbi:MAG: glycosyltransferase family 39 protein [Myxococcota bacterium]
MAAFALVKVAVARKVELLPVEAYSWMWAQHPQLAYFDHPGMTSWIVRASTMLVGHSLLGVRALALACSLGTTAMVFHALRRMYDERTAEHVSLLFLLLPVTAVTGALAAPDSPLLFFWCATLWALVRASSEGRLSAWLLSGLFLGLALDSKYHAALLAIGISVYLAVCPEQRPWLKRREPYLGALVAVVAFAPTLVWNAQHGLKSFLYQGARIGGQPFTVKELGNFALTQLFLVTPIVFAQIWVVCARGLQHWRDTPWQDRLLLAVSLPALLLFIAVGFLRPLRSNWPAPGYLGTIALAGVAAVRRGGWGLRLQRATLATLAAGYLAVGVAVQAAPAIWFSSWAQLARETSASRPDFVIASGYHLASELGFSNPGVATFDLAPLGLASKSFADWWRPEEFAGRHAVIVMDSTKPKLLRSTLELVRQAFDRVDEPRKVSVTRMRGRTRSFMLVDAWGYRPRPRPIDPARLESAEPPK